MTDTPSAALGALQRRQQSLPVQIAGGTSVESHSRALPGARIAVHADLSGVEQVWRGIEPTAPCSVFQNFDYLHAWFRHIGAREGVTPAVVVIRDPDRVLALLPLAIVRERFFRRLTWLGQELCDYSMPLLTPEFATLSTNQFRAVWREICTLMQSHPRFRHDWIEFRRMPESFEETANPFQALPVARHASDAYLTHLGKDWSDFYRARRSAKARKQDRSKLARLAEMGDVRLVTAGRPAEIAGTLDALFAQKAETLERKGIDDIFERPGYREFFLDLATNERTRDLIHVSALVAGSSLAAVNFGMEYRRRYSLFLISYDRSIARLSPGVIHLNKLMEHAIGRGVTGFDFLVGEQRLKLEWADRTIVLFDYIAAATLRGHLRATPVRLLARLKRGIKQTPALWTAFQSLRAAVGSVRRRIGL